MARARTLAGISVFWIGLSMVGDGFTTLVVPLRLAPFGDPASLATLIGTVSFVALGAGMLVQPVAGALSDRVHGRWGRRGPLALGAALLIAALAVFLVVPSLAGVVLAFVAIQIALNFAQAAQQGFIPDLIETRWRGRAAGLKGAADLGGAFLAFLVLAALLGFGDVTPAVVLIGAVVGATALATLVLVRERPVRISASPPERAEHASVLANGPFVALVAARFLFLLGTFAVGRFLLLLVAERFGLDLAGAAAEAAGILAVLALVTALMAVPAGWVADRVGRVEPMVVGGVTGAVGVLLLVAASSIAEMVLFGAVLAVGTALFTSANWAMTTDVVPPESAARFMGLANIGTVGAAAVAGLFGPLSDALRALDPALGSAGVLLGAAVAMLLSVAVLRPLGIGLRIARTPEEPAISG